MCQSSHGKCVSGGWWPATVAETTETETIDTEHRKPTHSKEISQKQNMWGQPSFMRFTEPDPHFCLGFHVCNKTNRHTRNHRTSHIQLTGKTSPLTGPDWFPFFGSEYVLLFALSRRLLVPIEHYSNYSYIPCPHPLFQIWGLFFFNRHDNTERQKLRRPKP